MKQLIVCAALLPLLLAFVLQFMLMEERYAAVTRSEGAARSAAERAAYEGGFSAENEARLRSEIASAFHISADRVEMELDRRPGEAGGTIYYAIRIPTGKILAVPRLFGVSPRENEGVFEIRGAVQNLLYWREVEAEPEGAEDER
ncbi:MAG: hypothetical protein LBC58_07275 [Clostridiales Family XIII bacterium]|jgi:hypothetical protein|nr:hypothetical protein [Clostridiales Family XIII bacterium]